MGHTSTVIISYLLGALVGGGMCFILNRPPKSRKSKLSKNPNYKERVKENKEAIITAAIDKLRIKCMKEFNEKVDMGIGSTIVKFNRLEPEEEIFIDEICSRLVFSLTITNPNISFDLEYKVIEFYNEINKEKFPSLEMTVI